MPYDSCFLSPVVRFCYRANLLTTLCLALVSGNAHGQVRDSAERTMPPAEYQHLARDIFRELIETNTTHAVGTTRAAEAMATRLKAGGFPAADVQVLAPKPGKENVVVRLRGRGSKRPILIIAHLDVVDARREDWTVDPFAFTEKDGFFYGRGTSDDKAECAELVTNFIRLHREAYVGDRDIVLALTADEESGGDANGVEWLLQSHRDLVDAEFAINSDVGGGHLKNGQHLRLVVQAAEKTFLAYRAEATSPGGHGSMPRKDNPIYRLADALGRLKNFSFPVRLNETTRAFFERSAPLETGQIRADMQALAQDPSNTAAAASLAEASPYYNAIMRTICVATLIEGGHAVNALPQRAQAMIQCRMLPEDNADNVEATLWRVLADPQIVLTAVRRDVTAPSTVLSPAVLRVVEAVVANIWPGTAVIPVMDPWSSDSKYVRKAGLPVYGIKGMFGDPDDIRAHGKDERIRVRSFHEGTEFMYRLLKALTSAQ